MQFIKPEIFTATLASKVQLTADTWEFDFTFTPGSFPYKAGHFAMMIFDHEGKTEQRAYSISSPPSNNSFQICVKLIPNGKGSTFLANLPLGAKVQFKGPFGMFFIKDDNAADLILVATGTGIGPMKSIILDLLARGDGRRIELLFGVRHQQGLLFTDLLAELSAKHPNFTYQITLSSIDGRVTAYLDQFNFAKTAAHLYICGSGAMVKDVRNFALEQGMDKAAIHVENFG
ncbi:hypothetical protein COV81_04550 [Candidatus Peregrinibacteria bacterium CG11_big_fil_rev_8_21_14_0_20_41_10]|nr:MAG: hypothetical protein COV81_04550 [Candidatus Peregrinibacteria bacterium CG11_big_fil_rev_8_21_14_0_20_41_10]PIZ74624.1 MAG: hypothetical protein COY06_03890 [Candidatus Peregrinibacteria bacterium CG_4_10_14_0_2_um_filter_41_8]